MLRQAELFPDEIEFIQVDSVIGSGFENDVAALAKLFDGVAYRAEKKYADSFLCNNLENKRRFFRIFYISELTMKRESFRLFAVGNEFR